MNRPYSEQARSPSHFVSHDPIIYHDMTDAEFLIAMENKLKDEDDRSRIEKWVLKTLFYRRTETLRVTGYEILRLIELAQVENDQTYVVSYYYLVNIETFRPLLAKANANAG